MAIDLLRQKFQTSDNYSRDQLIRDLRDLTQELFQEQDAQDVKLTALARNGLWVPRISFGGNSVGITYAAQNGNWDRKGNIVHFGFDLQLSNKGTSVGNVVLDNLPFTVLPNSPGAGNIGYIANMNLSQNTTMTLMVFNTVAGSLVYLQEIGQVGTSQLTNAQFTNTSRIIGGGWYRTADA